MATINLCHQEIDIAKLAVSGRFGVLNAALGKP
jgi:hypothetical protein